MKRGDFNEERTAIFYDRKGERRHHFLM